MKGHRLWIILAAAAYFAVMGCVMWPPDGRHDTAFEGAAPAAPVANLSGLPYRGIAMQVQRIDNVADYTKSVDQIAALGADTVLFTVDSKQENGNSSHIFLDMRSSPTPDKLGELIRYAKGKKLRVVLMPLVLLENPRGTEWRGTIHPELWEDWWESYREMLHHYATVAEANHVDVMAVGSELVSTENTTSQWSLTIRQMRRDFHGQLTYSANWDHYAAVPFWDQLDLVAINSYYTLGENSSVTVPQIVSKWHDIQKGLFAFEKKVGRPFFFMEVGWCSQANAAKVPWDYTQTTVPVDLELQKKLYEGFFESWWGVKEFGGFMIWAWDPNGGGPNDRGYTPHGKPAEEVLRQWLAKGPWKVQ